MRFMTPEECRSWAVACQVPLDQRQRPAKPDSSWHQVRRLIPIEHSRLTWFCRYVERHLRPRKGCLVWVTDWGIWEENTHLYYRLRQSYADQRLLHEAPGHLFLDYEAHDLISLLEVAILCGWDAHLLPIAGYSRAFISHDEYVDFASEPGNAELASAFAAELAAPSSGPAA